MLVSTTSRSCRSTGRAEYGLNRIPRLTAMSPIPYAGASVIISSASAIKPLDRAHRRAAMPGARQHSMKASFRQRGFNIPNSGFPVRNGRLAGRHPRKGTSEHTRGTEDALHVAVVNTFSIMPSTGSESLPVRRSAKRPNTESAGRSRCSYVARSAFTATR